MVICGVLHDSDLQVLTLAVPSKFRGNGLSSTAGVREFQVLQGKAYYWTIQTIHSHYRAKWMWWVDIWWGTIKASFQGLFVLFQSFKAYNSCSCMAFCISLSGSNHMTVVLWSFLYTSTNNLRSGSIFVSLWKLHSGGQDETQAQFQR